MFCSSGYFEAQKVQKSEISMILYVNSLMMKQLSRNLPSERLYNSEYCPSVAVTS